MTRIVDLTVPFGPDTLSPPSVGTPVRVTPHHRGPGFWQVSSVEMVLHTGSHVDFARHCRADGETAEQVALERTCGEAVVVDVSHIGEEQEIRVADLEDNAPDIRPGDIVLVRTLWSERAWGRFPDYYLRSPWCHPDAARWLVERGAKAVGFDCFSEYAARLPDFTSEDFVVHKAVLDGGAILMQQLTNLSQLPLGERVAFYGAFLKVAGGEGAPARFFAVV